MRVLAIASSGRLGGAELSLTEFLRHRPADVQAFALVLGDGGLGRRLQELDVPAWIARDYDGRPTVRQAGRFTRSLLQVLEQARPDVLLAVGIKAALLAAPGARLAGVPIVWQKVDFSYDGPLVRALGMAVDGVVAVSDAAAEALGPARVRRLLAVIGPPIRLPDEPYGPPAGRQPVIGTLAALAPYKGQHHIVAAAGLLAQEFPQLRVVLAGESLAAYPDHASELRDLAARLGIAERVELRGFVEDVTEVLGELAVYVNATYRDERGFGLEGLAGGMLEASWVGVPVVATSGGGTPEGLLQGVTGTLVDAPDSDGLAGAIAPYLRDPALARRTGEAGRRFARERFAPGRAAERLFDALRTVAARDGAR
jgi:glycosyltransferase involved in cell wall biosynthesis